MHMKKKEIKQNELYKLKPIAIDQNRVSTRIVDGAQMLTNIIRTYLIQNLSKKTQQKQRHMSAKYKYKPIEIVIQINSQSKIHSFDIMNLLEKYVKIEKNNIYRQQNIELLVSDILNFIEESQNKINILTEFNIKNSQDALQRLIEQFHRIKQKDTMQNQYDQYKQKALGKYQKVSFNSNESNSFGKKQNEFSFYKSIDDNSQRASRTTIFSIDQDQKSNKNKNHLQAINKSKLKLLVDRCNVFDYPEKIQLLKKQKLISAFCKNQAEFIEFKQQSKKQQSQIKNVYKDDLSKILEDWINDITLSQKLFKKKYEPERNKDEKARKKSTDSSSNSDFQN